jgi:HlyD family secretion protein
MDQPNPSKRKKIIIGVVALLVVGTVVKFLFFKTNFIYDGTIEATKVDVPARVTSVISKLSVKEGDHLQKGQSLMTLSCEDYKLAQEIATQDFDRADRLFKAGSQARETYDQMKNRKEDADLKITWCDVTSPLTGVVLNKYHEEGEMVAPGTRLFTLANLKENIYAYIYIPQELVATVKLGEKLTGTLPELKQQKFDGTVTQVSDEAEFTPKNVQTREERTRLVYAIKVMFNNPDEILKPGMTVEVKLPEN